MVAGRVSFRLRLQRRLPNIDPTTTTSMTAAAMMPPAVAGEAAVASTSAVGSACFVAAASRDGVDTSPAADWARRLAAAATPLLLPGSELEFVWEGVVDSLPSHVPPLGGTGEPRFGEVIDESTRRRIAACVQARGTILGARLALMLCVGALALRANDVSPHTCAHF